MTSGKEKELIESQAYLTYINWRNRFVLKLAIFHIALIIVFDVVAIYSPAVLTVAVWKGSVFSSGLVIACGMVISVVLSAFYYSWRVNQEDIIFTKRSEQSEKNSG
jgi:uncharacterized membrane protein (DUF485 family)